MPLFKIVNQKINSPGYGYLPFVIPAKAGIQQGSKALDARPAPH
jgi:hypothetical protein